MSEKKINKRIVLAGAPGTGKTSVINELKKKNFYCFEEAARDIFDEFKLKGLEFKTNPVGISKNIFKKRKLDFESADQLECKQNIIFFDRGIHEVTAYLRSIGNSSNYWDNLPSKYKYDLIFIFEPWKEIYKKDDNRNEDFSDVKKISPFIISIYEQSGIKMIKVPNINIEERVKFILDKI
jgi:predicted ATPase|tara:strand:- start:994 stop:1536 length:543 start_codon:yes stop_codon:yes gene_type:complete